MNLFFSTWSALRAAVAALPPEAFGEPSGCRGWRVRDLVCHLVFDAQDVLVTLATPAESAPTADALSYWTPSPAPTAEAAPPDHEEPLEALTRRLAAAYEDPALLQHHFEDVGAAAGRAALLAHSELPVATQGRSLTVRDYLGAHVLEWVLHHLDLIAHRGEGAGFVGAAAGPAVGRAAGPAVGPSAEALAAARSMVERRLRLELPATWGDADALRIATGRRLATPAQQSELDAIGARATMLPLSFT